MHHRLLLLTAAGLLSLAFTAAAQLAPRPPAAPAPQPPPPPQPLDEKEAAKTLVRLAEMAKNLDIHKRTYNERVIKELREAGVSGEKSFALWLDCKKDVDFDQKGISITKFAEWKRGETKDPNRARDAGLQLQVQWLMIVMMHANARTDAERGDVISAAVQFVDNYVSQMDKLDGGIQNPNERRQRQGEDHSQQGVLDSVFARHYKLEATVSPVEGGAYVPGDVDNIYESMILPHYRSVKQYTNLISAWKKRITQQTAIASSYPFKEAREKFDAEKLPELQWGQARDLFALGLEQSASQTMVSILQSHMAHPRASEWLAELTALLNREEYVPKAKRGKPNGKPAEPESTPLPQPEAGPANGVKPPAPDASKPSPGDPAKSDLPPVRP